MIATRCVHSACWHSLNSGEFGLKAHSRYVATPRVAKHRVFVWLDACIIPDSRIFAFVRSDDTFFGIIHSRFHESWSLRTCSWHGVGNDPTYNSAGVFETFPFPEGLSPNIPAAQYAANPHAQAIAAAANRTASENTAPVPFESAYAIWTSWQHSCDRDDQALMQRGD